MVVLAALMGRGNGLANCVRDLLELTKVEKASPKAQQVEVNGDNLSLPSGLGKVPWKEILFC